MNEAQYKISYEQTKRLLKKYGLSRAIIEPRNSPSAPFLTASRSNHFSMYRTAIENRDYNIVLFDESILQFNFAIREGKLILRYAYYQVPFDFVSYEDYLESRGIRFEDVGEAFREDYSQFLNELEVKENSVVIRYDHSEAEYIPAIHAVSHLHFGCDNTIRIPINKILTPFIFIIFIIKQVYYPRWKSFMKDTNFVDKQFKISKASCMNIHSRFFNQLDKIELFLS